jgi:hemolysin III
MRRPVEPPTYTVAEEIAHGVSHGIGIVLAIAGLAVLVTSAALRGDVWHVATVAVYGTTLILLYTASTLYHSIPLPRAKRVLRILDHAAIYLLIAGTYTPFALVSLRGPWGWGLFVLVWGGAVCGIVFKSVATGRARILSVVLYVLLGWAVVVAARPLAAAVPRGGIALLVAGGIFYTAGLVFFGWKRLRFHHFLWHLCVLAGSVLHYFAILFYVIPARP